MLLQSMKNLVFLAAAVIFAASSSHGKQNYAGVTYTCFFQKSGKVIINTKPIKPYINFKGKTYPALSGSYFYYVDGKFSETYIAIMFNRINPKKWTLLVGEDFEESTKSCKIMKNKL
jgi:hypothetical protein